MSPVVIDGKKFPTMTEDIEELEATIKELRKRVKEEREIADEWFKLYMELRNEMQQMRNKC